MITEIQLALRLAGQDGQHVVIWAALVERVVPAGQWLPLIKLTEMQELAVAALLH
jgi:hypothetical protein